MLALHLLSLMHRMTSRLIFHHMCAHRTLIRHMVAQCKAKFFLIHYMRQPLIHLMFLRRLRDTSAIRDDIMDLQHDITPLAPAPHRHMSCLTR